MGEEKVIYEHSKLAIDLLPDEHVLNVQRQHWIALGILFITHGFFIGLVFAIITSLVVFKLFSVYPEFFIYLTSLFLSILAVLGTYACMKWYFTFYIVTNKRLIIRQYFKIIGTYYQELLLRNRVEMETKRVTSNIIYDLMDIEDIYVTIHTEDIPEPFLFKTPRHPEQIEKALSEIETVMIKA